MPNITDELLDAINHDDVSYLKFATLYCGVGIDDCSDDGNSLLMEAAYNGALNCLNFLLIEGANINQKNKHDYDALAMAAFGKHKDCILPLTQYGAKLDGESNGGYTALIFAVISGCEDTVEALLTNGADPEYCTKHKKTALSEARDDNIIEILKSAILKKQFNKQEAKKILDVDNFKKTKKERQKSSQRNIRKYVKNRKISTHL